MVGATIDALDRAALPVIVTAAASITVERGRTLRIVARAERRGVSAFSGGGKADTM